MKHYVKQRAFGRVRRQRTALLRSLAIALIMHGRIETTDPKAKELRPFIEKLVTKAREGTHASGRLVAARLGTENMNVARKLITEIAPRYIDRSGGYTRITKLGRRAKDAAPMAVIEFV